MNSVEEILLSSLHSVLSLIYTILWTTITIAESTQTHFSYSSHYLLPLSLSLSAPFFFSGSFM